MALEEEDEALADGASAAENTCEIFVSFVDVVRDGFEFEFELERESFASTYRTSCEGIALTW